MTVHFLPIPNYRSSIRIGLKESGFFQHTHLGVIGRASSDKHSQTQVKTMNIIFGILIILIILVILGWTGLKIKPKPFKRYIIPISKLEYSIRDMIAILILG